MKLLRHLKEKRYLILAFTLPAILLALAIVFLQPAHNHAKVQVKVATKQSSSSKPKSSSKSSSSSSSSSSTSSSESSSESSSASSTVVVASQTEASSSPAVAIMVLNATISTSQISGLHVPSLMTSKLSIRPLKLLRKIMTKHQSFMFWLAESVHLSQVLKRKSRLSVVPLWLTRTVMNGFVRNGVFQFVNIGKFLSNSW